ncbi:hypothetical protein Golob_010602, partial [Gossypium lobatum]|nr:hypothetical protein [Gossypium lobatum]
MALARKWKTMAGFGRRTISINRKPARAGHFVVHSSDKRRFVVPLAYLRTKVFQELLRLAEEEFGMPKDGPITLPCDAAVLEYVLSLLQSHVSSTLEKKLLFFIGLESVLFHNGFSRPGLTINENNLL